MPKFITPWMAVFIVFLLFGFNLAPLSCTKDSPSNVLPDAAVIAVSQGQNALSNGATVDFGNVLLNATQSLAFSISNTGGSNLDLTGSSPVLLGGTDSSLFTITQPSSTSIAPGSSVDFSVSFTPTTSGNKSASLTIENNDPNNGTLTISLTGTGVVETANGEIHLTLGADDIASGQTVDFGNVALTMTREKIFTIHNNGSENLSLTGDPIVNITGANASAFSSTTPSTTIAPASSATFTVTFEPTSEGTKTANLSIENNDSDENPYTITLTGNATATPEAEMDVLQDTTDIVSGGSFDFGQSSLNYNNQITFTIKNTGSATLTFTGDPLPYELTGADVDQFSVGLGSSSILPDSSKTFTITFNPDSIGSKSAILSIPNNDSDENPYTINLSGEGVNASEIDLSVSGATLEINDTYDFGTMLVGLSSLKIFTIENLGSSDLTLSGSPDLVAKSGTDADQFTVTDPASNTIVSEESITFTIEFSPSSTGIKTANISIANNDSDENPFTFTIIGTGTNDIEPEIHIKDWEDNDLISGSGIFDYGSVAVDGNSQRQFKIFNYGTKALNLSGTPKVAISGSHASEFEVHFSPSSPVPADSLTFFNLRFSPTSQGSKTATVSIANDDNDENPYTFTITGYGVLTGDINVSKDSISYPGESNLKYDLGQFSQGDPLSTVTFDLENTGGMSLSLTGNPKVTVSNDTYFSVATQPAVDTIDAGSSTTFDISFNPSTAGNYQINVEIPSDDPDESNYQFTMIATVVSAPTPYSVIKQNSFIYPSESNYDFGQVEVGDSLEITFVIENTGSDNLVLTGPPYVNFFMGGEGFAVTQQPSSGTITPSNSETFKITYTPTSSGSSMDAFFIGVNDGKTFMGTPDTYGIILNGEGIGPDILVDQNGTDMEDTGGYDFGNIVQGNNKTADFNLTNVGELTLNLTGSFLVELDDYTHFDVSSQPAQSSLSPDQNTTFTLEYNPASVGNHSANVSIANNTTDENPYTFAISGNATASPEPEMDLVDHYSDLVLDGALYDMGTTQVNETTQLYFTIQNNGTATLNLSGSPRVVMSGADTDQFSLNQPPVASVDADEETIFTLTFEPTSYGTKTIDLSIDNNDGDENPYNFTVEAFADQPMPDITVLHGDLMNELFNGETIDFGSVYETGTTEIFGFEIYNISDELELYLTDPSPYISISGPDAALFSIEVIPTTPIEPLNMSTFTYDYTLFAIGFDPSGTGSYSATISIANDDLSDNPFVINLQGSGKATLGPEIHVTQGTEDIYHGLGYDFGDVSMSSPVDVVFTINNDGDSDLVLGDPAIEINEYLTSGMYTLETADPANQTITQGNSIDFTIRMDASMFPFNGATIPAHIEIHSNDTNENPYIFMVIGKIVE